jgi:hypothetical protein
VNYSFTDDILPQKNSVVKRTEKVSTLADPEVV